VQGTLTGSLKEYSSYSSVAGLIDLIVELSTNGDIIKGRIHDSLDGMDKEKFILISIGKSAQLMAEAVIEAGVNIEGGVIVVPRGTRKRITHGTIEYRESSHPVPDESSLEAGNSVLEWARASRSSNTSLIVLVSGGGSALVEVPVEPITLDDIRDTTRLLLASGASIHEMNAVRKHVSLIKGGRLAEVAYPSKLLALYASDVPGDRLDTIASGPTVPDPTTYADAVRVLEDYNIKHLTPERVVKVLEEGMRGLRPETPKPGSPVFNNVTNRLVAANIDVLLKIRDALESRGYNTLILTSRLEGESRDAGRVLASITMEALDRGIPVKPPFAIIAGGETTVTLGGGHGEGGRNQELALSWALSMRYWGYLEQAVIAALDTDGIDGYSDAAGAYIAPLMLEDAYRKGVDPGEELKRHNSYRVFKTLGTLIKTGPTEVNLNSIVVILSERDA